MAGGVGDYCCWRIGGEKGIGRDPKISIGLATAFCLDDLCTVFRGDFINNADKDGGPL